MALSGRNAELRAYTFVEIVDDRDLVIGAEGGLEASNLSDAAIRVDLGGKDVHRLLTYPARVLHVTLTRIGGREVRLSQRGFAANGVDLQPKGCLKVALCPPPVLQAHIATADQLICHGFVHPVAPGRLAARGW